MKPEPLYDSNESNGLAHANGWHKNPSEMEHQDAVIQQNTESLFLKKSVGSFQMTDAIRPGQHTDLLLQQGFRRETYLDSEKDVSLSMILAAASSEFLFDLYLDLLSPLGNVVDVVLETSHQQRDGSHQDLYRDHIDLPVLKSVFCDHESLLMSDGCTGVAVINAAEQMEVQFDEHKMLLIYANNLVPFEKILLNYDVWPLPGIEFITEVDHVHCSSPQQRQWFDQLSCRLGMDVWSEAGI